MLSHEQRLIIENENLHALLADASTTLFTYSLLETIGRAAKDCLDRIAAGEPRPPYPEDGQV